MVAQLAQAVGDALTAEISALAERVRAGVVRISNGRGSGSGTIWDQGGLIVTNYHVVPGEGARVTFADGRQFPGRAVASLPERDLAVIRVEATDLPALPVGDSGTLRAGALVLAVGHPLGVPGAVTLGIFSGVGPIEGRGDRHFQEALLADIELRPGNSGGPLVNARGEVIGINAMVLGPRTALAVPSATVIRLLGGRARRVLGVRLAPVRLPGALATRDDLRQETALMLIDVAANSSAERAGLLPGDIILALDGHAIEEPGDLAWGLAEAQESAAISVQLLRGGQRHEVVIAPDPPATSMASAA